jgi:hypothetical protein
VIYLQTSNLGSSMRLHFLPPQQPNVESSRRNRELVSSEAKSHAASVGHDHSKAAEIEVHQIKAKNAGYQLSQRHYQYKWSIKKSTPLLNGALDPFVRLAQVLNASERSLLHHCKSSLMTKETGDTHCYQTSTQHQSLSMAYAKMPSSTRLGTMAWRS